MTTTIRPYARSELYSWQINGRKVCVFDTDPASLTVRVNEVHSAIFPVDRVSLPPSPSSSRIKALKEFFSLRLPTISLSRDGECQVQFVSATSQKIADAQRRGNKILVLLRHAERTNPDAQTLQPGLHLTPWGRKSSAILGQELKEFPIPVLYTSPIQCCVDTCTEMGAGLKRELIIKQSTLLGDPGHFTANGDLAGPLFQSTSLVDILREIAQGNHLSEMRSLEEEAKLFLEWALHIEDEIAIMVSHDAMITLIALLFFEGSDVPQSMPQFLEGLYIERKSNGELIVHYKNQSQPFSPETLQNRMKSLNTDD